MKVHNEFTIPLPPAQAWSVLNDIPRVASCVPGAKLLETPEPGVHVGTVAVRLGPVALSFKGKFVYKTVDATAHHVQAEANGSEQKARGSARALVDFVLIEEAAGTRVSVDSDIQLAGSIAQYARGGTLIESTAQVLMDQFAENLRAELNASKTALQHSAEHLSIPHDAGSSSTGVHETPRVAQEIAVGRLVMRSLKLALRRWFGGLFASRG